MLTRSDHRMPVLAYFYRLAYEGTEEDVFIEPIILEFCPPYSEPWLRDAAEQLVEEGLLGASQEVKFGLQPKRIIDLWKLFVPTGIKTSRFISATGKNQIETILSTGDTNIYDYIEQLKSMR